MQTSTKKIVICDDHPLFLAGITALLLKFGNNYHINAFGDTANCENFLKKNSVDVFICDLNINAKDGFLLVEDLKMELRRTKTIILTAYYEDFLIKKARKSGVSAFLKKETTAEELIAVIESGIGEPFYTNNSFKKSFNEYNNLDQTAISRYRLSKQEKEIIKNIIDGKTSKQIADILFISKTTVDTHRKNIFKKLEISNSTTLIKFANENNLFS